MKDFLSYKVMGIEKVFRTHPLPKLPNFSIVKWENKDLLKSADIFIQTNIAENKHIKLLPQYNYIRNSGKPWIVVESPVFRKNMFLFGHPKAYHRWSWFSYFRDEGNYNNQSCPGDRWLQIQTDQNIEIKDWRISGEYILVIMQRPGDSSLKNLLAKHGTYENFLKRILEKIKENTNKPIRVRLHPIRQDKQLAILEKFNVEISSNTHGATRLEGGDGLYEDFKNAWAVVGFNSNALTESICEGIPTFSLCSSSMAWECSNKDLGDLDHPLLFDRQQWLNNLGYCQWREDEIAEGIPYYHLMKIYDKIKL